MVDLIKPEPKSASTKESRQVGRSDDLMAAEMNARPCKANGHPSPQIQDF
jgi:hypothetical protein